MRGHIESGRPGPSRTICLPGNVGFERLIGTADLSLIYLADATDHHSHQRAGGSGRAFGARRSSREYRTDHCEPALIVDDDVLIIVMRIELRDAHRIPVLVLTDISPNPKS